MAAPDPALVCNTRWKPALLVINESLSRTLRTPDSSPDEDPDTPGSPPPPLEGSVTERP